VEGQSIKLARNDSPDGQHHFIPLSWVEGEDDQVNLTKNSVEPQQGGIGREGV
jgi:hypothetical protein